MNPHLEDRRGFLLFPVGFQDGITYRELARHLSIDVAPHIDLGLSISSQFYNNRGRCSIKQLDEDFIQILKILYGSKTDGIIAPYKLPDIIRNGYQHREMCVFDKTIMMFDKEIARIHGGGDSKIKNGVQTVLTAIDLDTPEIREASALLREFLSTHADEIRRTISNQRNSSINLSDIRHVTQPLTRKTRKRRRSPPLPDESK
jgi:hypothetical protein